MRKPSERRVILAGFFMVLVCGICAFGQEESPVLWGPILGAIGEDYIAITWKTSRAVAIRFHYARAEVYDETGDWEETLVFEPHKGVAEIWLRDLIPGTTYRYQIVFYEGDAVHPRPIGRFTTSSPEIRSFSFLVYGNTRTYPERHALVAAAMTRNEPDAMLVFHTGDLVEYPTIERFERFFAAIAELALSRPFITIVGSREKDQPTYYEFFPLPAGGGKASEQWWSFTYGNVHFVGLDSNVLIEADTTLPLHEQIEWLQADLAQATADFTVVFLHHPIYSSTWEGGVNRPLQALLEPIFITAGVDVVFTGHMRCYEHFFVNGIHHIGTGGGGAPLQEPVDRAAAWTVFRRYNTLHYMRITVSADALQVAMIPVASVIDGEIHPVPGRRAVTSFTIMRDR
ncbi:metallophosphoesterase [Candidatus Bipolaricaulota bacterium]|nr:metallophosphoesterase [Candidatus Bipolaricaulota bacterium]